MEYFDAEGLCLKAIDYKDNDKLLTLYCSEKGKITVVARGCKSAKAKLKFASSPLCFGHYYMTCKSARFVLTGCDCNDNFFSVTDDILKYYCALTAIELLDKMTLEGDYNNELFVGVLTFLNTLCYGELIDAKKLLFEFILHTISALGYHTNAKTLRGAYEYFVNNFDTNLKSLKGVLDL